MQTNKAVPIKDYLNSLMHEYSNLDKFWRQQSKGWDNSLYDRLMAMSGQINQVKLSIEQGVKWYVPF